MIVRALCELVWHAHNLNIKILGPHVDRILFLIIGALLSIVTPFRQKPVVTQDDPVQHSDKDIQGIAWSRKVL